MIALLLLALLPAVSPGVSFGDISPYITASPVCGGGAAGAPGALLHHHACAAGAGGAALMGGKSNEGDSSAGSSSFGLGSRGGHGLGYARGKYATEYATEAAPVNDTSALEPLTEFIISLDYYTDADESAFSNATTLADTIITTLVGNYETTLFQDNATEGLGAAEEGYTYTYVDDVEEAEEEAGVGAAAEEEAVAEQEEELAEQAQEEVQEEVVADEAAVGGKTSAGEVRTTHHTRPTSKHHPRTMPHPEVEDPRGRTLGRPLLVKSARPNAFTLNRHGHSLHCLILRLDPIPTLSSSTL